MPTSEARFTNQVNTALPVIKYALQMKDIADRVKQLRNELGLNQEELGRLAGVTKSAVSQWERGLTQPQRDALMALQSRKRINPDWVIHGKGSPFIDVVEGKMHARLPPPSIPLGLHAIVKTDTNTLPPELKQHIDEIIRLWAAGKLSNDKLGLLIKLASPDEPPGEAGNS